MWVHEHAAQTDVPREQVWKALADIDGWIAWDTSMETIRLDGPFAVGSRVLMTPAGQDPIEFTIVEITDQERYADETTFGGAVLRFSHTLSTPTDGTTRIVHRLEITGADADTLGPELGPMITEDFPDAMTGLITHAATLA